MPRRPPLSRALAELIAKLEPELAGAFLDAMADLTAGMDFAALQAALERGDIEAAIRALNIEPGAFSQYVSARTTAYSQAGALEAAYIPTADAESISFRFDMTNPRAERWIKEQAAERVVGYTREATDTARAVILEGYSRGDGPKQIALDIAGRVNPATGRRSGGIVGLSEPQAGYVQSMRQRLFSGDSREMRKVLSGMTLRDKRFDRLIEKHIETGTPLSRADVDKLTGRYSDRLLKRRAEDIARTETAQGVMGARAEAYRQALEKEGLPPEAITKTWLHQGAKDEDARVQHIAMNGREVIGLETPFTMPDGARMQHSHDPAGGVRHNINCRCDTFFEVDFTWGLG